LDSECGHLQNYLLLGGKLGVVNLVEVPIGGELLGRKFPSKIIHSFSSRILKKLGSYSWF